MKYIDTSLRKMEHIKITTTEMLQKIDDLVLKRRQVTLKAVKELEQARSQFCLPLNTISETDELNDKAKDDEVRHKLVRTKT